MAKKTESADAGELLDDRRLKKLLAWHSAFPPGSAKPFFIEYEEAGRILMALRIARNKIAQLHAAAPKGE